MVECSRPETAKLLSYVSKSINVNKYTSQMAYTLFVSSFNWTHLLYWSQNIL